VNVREPRCIRAWRTFRRALGGAQLRARPCTSCSAVVLSALLWLVADPLAVTAHAQRSGGSTGTGTGTRGATGPSNAEPVVLVVPDCLDAPSADVTKLIALELAPRVRLVPAPRRGAPRLLTATVVCPTGARARRSVDDPTRTVPLRVELDLARTPPEARARLLALSLAELIASSRLERSARARTGESAAQAAAAAGTRSSTSTGTATGAAASAETGKAAGDDGASDDGASDDGASDDESDDNEASARADRARAASAEDDAASVAPSSSAAGPGGRNGPHIWLAPGLSRAGAPGTMLFGVDAGGGYPLGALTLGLELQARWGRAGLDEADVDMRMFSAAITATPSLALGELELLLGPGLRAGYGWLSAHALRDDFDGQTLDGAFFGPIGVAAAHLDISRYSAMRFALEVGYAARSLVGNAPGQRELLALRGVWLSATLGLSLRL
jgi:hypothetical protein